MQGEIVSNHLSIFSVQLDKNANATSTSTRIANSTLGDS